MNYPVRVCWLQPFGTPATIDVFKKGKELNKDRACTLLYSTCNGSYRLIADV